MPSRQYETYPSPFPFYRSNVVCVEMHDRRSDPEKRVQIICSPKAILSYTLSVLSRYPIRYKVAENRKCYRMGRVQSIYSGREREGKWAVLQRYRPLTYSPTAYLTTSSQPLSPPTPPHFTCSLIVFHTPTTIKPSNRVGVCPRKANGSAIKGDVTKSCSSHWWLSRRLLLVVQRAWPGTATRESGLW